MHLHGEAFIFLGNAFRVVIIKTLFILMESELGSKFHLHEGWLVFEREESSELNWDS